MKVLVVGTGGALGGSGVTTVADQMARSLERMGHEPLRVVMGDRQRQRPNRLNIENVRAVLSEARAVARVTRQTKPDLVWLHTMGVPTLPAIRALVQVLAVRSAGGAVVAEFHTFGLAGEVAQAGRLQRTVLRSMATLSRCLVVLHSADAEALRRQVPAEKVAILPNWVEVPPTATPLPSHPPFIALFIGGLVQRKGVPQLIAAMRLLDDVPILLRIVGGAGDDGEAAALAIRNSADDLVATGRVSFVGQVNAFGVRQELRSAHLLVLPSRAEGTPMAVLEALAEGRPVVVSDAGDMAEIVTEHACGVVIAAHDPAGIADALRHAVTDVRRLVAQGQAGHQAAMRKFSEHSSSAALTEVLRIAAHAGD